MVFRYIEGFDSLTTTTDVQEDGWRSSRTSGAIVSEQFGFAAGRLNARAFGNRRIISTEGLGRSIPTGMNFDFHIGFAKRYEIYRSSSTFREQVLSVITLMQTTTTLAQRAVAVLTYQTQARLFHITLDEKTGTGIVPIQRTVTVPAPLWFDPQTWNYFEFIVTNEGREFYAFINGQSVISFINAAIPYQSTQFTEFYLGRFPNIEQWDYPVNTTGVGNGDIDSDRSVWYADDIFIKDSQGATPMGDFRMNDGAGVSDFSVEFTPTVGALNNFSQIDDDIPDGDISTVSANSTVRTDLYGHNAVTSSVVVPTTLTLKTRVYAKNGVAAPVNFVGIISDGLTTREGGPYSISTQYTNRSLIYNTDPNNASWTKSSIESVLVGFTNKVV